MIEAVEPNADEASMLQRRVQVLERRVKTLLLVAGLAALLGAAGLYVGLRWEPRRDRLVIENAEGRMVLTPTELVLVGRDGGNAGSRRAKLSLGSEGPQQVTLELSAGEESSHLRLASSVLRAEGDQPLTGWAALHLGGALDNHVNVSSRGPHILLNPIATKSSSWGSTRLEHSAGGMVVTTEVGDVRRATVLPAGEVVWRAGSPPPAAGEVPAPAPPSP